MEIKAGVGVKVKTGYKIYSGAGFKSSDVGEEVYMIFGSATALSACFTILVSALLTF